LTKTDHYDVNNNNLNERINFVKSSVTLVINELSSKLIGEGKEIFRLGFGQSLFSVPEKIVRHFKKKYFEKIIFLINRKLLSSLNHYYYSISAVVLISTTYIGFISKKLIHM